ncbi:MacB-like core domain-containing protein [Lachnospiraceae bacterium NK3A20]|nr:MacB-like core domain-containing protein [Lachnospiraceae bacterium NK3A20]
MLSNKTSVFRIIAAILAVAVAAISLELFIINIIFNRGSDTLQNNDLVYCRLMHEGNPFEYSFDQYTKMESDLKEIGNYYEIYFQYLETGEHADQQLYNMDTKRLDTTEKAVSSIQVEDKVISNCKLKTAEGRLFEPRDYVVEKDQQYFPVILGNVYRNTYKVGDIIQLYYLYSDLKFKVVGILQPDQSQMLGDVFCDFDTSIILPMFKVAEEAPAYFDKKGLLIHYSFLVSGISEIEGENFSDEIFSDDCFYYSGVIIC